MTPDQIQHGIEVGATVAVAVSHIIAVTGTPKWMPQVVVTLINLIAANYGKSKNKDSQ